MDPVSVNGVSSADDHYPFIALRQVQANSRGYLQRMKIVYRTYLRIRILDDRLLCSKSRQNKTSRQRENHFLHRTKFFIVYQSFRFLILLRVYRPSVNHPPPVRHPALPHPPAPPPPPTTHPPTPSPPSPTPPVPLPA